MSRDQVKKMSSAVNQIEDVSDEQMAQLSNTSKPIRLGAWVLLVGFGGFLAWAALAPLDQGVPSQGTVSIETRRKTIQHQTGGVVKVVHVKEGQWVKEGEVLLEIDETYARANFETIKPTYLTLRAAESRLRAELAGASEVTFHKDLIKAQSDPKVRQLMETHRTLFESRRTAMASDLSALNQGIEALKAQQSGIAEVIKSRTVQASLQEKHLKSIRELASEGYAPTNQVIQMEQAQADLKASMSDLLSNQVKISRAIAEAEQRLIQRRQEYIKEITTQLSDIGRDVQGGQEKMQAAAEDLSRTQIRTPVAGQVVSLAVGSTGGVVTPGQKIMDIVPQEEELLIDAHIQPFLIDKVKVGMDADVRFSTFSSAPQLVATGKIISLSTDAVPETNPTSAMSAQNTFYLARVKITPEGMKTLGRHVMQPGMPAEVLVKTGERSMLKYLLNPLTKRIASAMKEE